MRKLMFIHDAFRSDDDRLVIAGNNIKLNQLSRDEIKKIINGSITIKTTNNIEYFEMIADVDVSSSPFNQKDIFIKLDKNYDDIDPMTLINAKILIDN